MITLTSDNFKVEYQYDIMFNWSYNPVKVTYLSSGSDVLDYIDLEVSKVDGTGGVTFRRYFPKNGVVTFDISRGLQSVAQNEVKLTVYDEPGNEVSAFIYCINGANGAIEAFGADTRQIRVWDGVETILPFYFKNNIRIFAKKADGTEQIIGASNATTNTRYGFVQVPIRKINDISYIYASGLGFDGAKWSTNKEWRYKLKQGCTPRGESLYMRWYDRQGLRWFWLFQVNEMKTATEAGVEYGITPNVGSKGIINEFDGEASKIIARRTSLGAYQINADEYKVLSTLYTSVLVDAYDTIAKRWYRVKVPNGEKAEPRGNYKDFEVEIEFAPGKTQLP